jgi:hypothetical protein
MQRQVRLRLRAPPRSLVQTEISRLVANSPELAGIRVRISLCRLSIGFRDKITFPDGRDQYWWRLGSNAGSVGRKAEQQLPNHYGSAAMKWMTWARRLSGLHRQMQASKSRRSSRSSWAGATLLALIAPEGVSQERRSDTPSHSPPLPPFSVAPVAWRCLPRSVERHRGSIISRGIGGQHILHNI